MAEDLNIPYELVTTENNKEEPFLSLNPNGRLPVLEDPNNGIVLWEVSLSNVSARSSDGPR